MNTSDGGNNFGQMGSSKTLALLAVAAIVISLISLWLTMGRPKSLAPDLGIGQVLAEETAKVLHDQGRVVVVVANNSQQRGGGSHDLLEAFRTELKKHGTITVTAVETVPLDETAGGSPMNRISTSPGMSRAKLEELLAKHSGANALVLFVGLPPWDAENPITVSKKVPTIIAFQGDLTPMGIRAIQEYLTHGIVSVLIGPKMSFTPGSVGPASTPRERFNQLYQVYTPASQ